MSHEVCIGLYPSGESDRNEKRTILTGKTKELTELIKMLDIDWSSISEANLSERIVHELIENPDVCLFAETIKTMRVISEVSLVKVLNWVLSTPDETYSSYCTNYLERIPVEESARTESDKASERNCPLVDGKCYLVNVILKEPVTTKDLRKSLPSIDFKTSVKLAEYLTYLIGRLKDENAEMRLPSLKQCCVWMSMLLDCNYAQFVMSSEIDVQKCLLDCMNHVEDLVS